MNAVWVMLVFTMRGMKMMRTKKIYCPFNGWDCSYYEIGECGIEDPMSECDDFASVWDEDDDYVTDEERTAFE